MQNVNELMDFNPKDLSIFQEPVSSNEDSKVYKTNPNKFSKSEDGHYHARVRIIYNPFNIKDSIVKQTSYALRDSEGLFIVKSALADNDRNCPIFKAWKKLWFSNDPEKKEFAKKMFERHESKWVTVQVIEDDNQPELVGKFLTMKLPKHIEETMLNKINPSPESKKQPIPIMDYLIGRCLDLDVQPGPDDPKQPDRKNREISYSLCTFDDEITPIIQVDGTPLFNDSEMELIENYNKSRNDYLKAKEKDKPAKEQALKEAQTAVVSVYQKAIDYAKQNSVNVRDEQGFKEWSPELSDRVNRWCEIVVQAKDPADNLGTLFGTDATSDTGEIAETVNNSASDMPNEDGLPF